MTVSLVNKDNVVAKPDVSLAITQNQKCKELLSQGYKLEATHEYTDKDGITIFYKVRLKNAVTKDKQFLSVHFHDSAWVWKEPVFTNGLKPLYNLQLIVSNPTAKIWVCEGELKADRLNEFFVKHNLQSNNIATTSGSSSSANKADWAAIATHKVVIWPDNDESGQKYLNDVAKNLTDLNCDIQVVDIEKLNLPCKGDVVDWLEAKSNTAFVDFESIMLVSVPSEIEPLFNIAEASVADFLLTQPLPRKYLLEQCLPIGKTGLLAGMGGVRKSHLMLELMISIATGKPLCWNWVI